MSMCEGGTFSQPCTRDAVVEVEAIDVAYTCEALCWRHVPEYVRHLLKDYISVRIREKGKS